MFYKLENNIPIQCEMDEASKSGLVKQLFSTAGENRNVSTIFLGLDHSHGGPVPILFETMIFGGPHVEYQERYTTYELAEAGHKKACELINAK